jgi:hypothetical protein
VRPLSSLLSSRGALFWGEGVPSPLVVLAVDPDTCGALAVLQLTRVQQAGARTAARGLGADGCAVHGPGDGDSAGAGAPTGWSLQAEVFDVPAEQVVVGTKTRRCVLWAAPSACTVLGMPADEVGSLCAGH